MKRIILLVSLNFGLLKPMETPKPSQDSLIKAAQNGMSSAFGVLKNAGIDVNAVCEGTTALHEAVMLSVKSVQALLALGANPNTIDKDGITPLTKGILRVKAHSGKIGVNSEDSPHCKGGEIHASEKITLLLLKAGATPKPQDVQHTLEMGWGSMLKMLLEYNAPTDLKGTTPITIVCKKVTCDCYKNLVPLLLAHKTKNNIIEAKDSSGQTALFAACEAKKTYIFEMLLKAGADSEVKNNNSQTILIRAIEKNHLKHVKLLKKHKLLSAIIDEKDAQGETAIFYACRYHVGIDILRLLLESGAHVHLRNNAKQSVLAKAIEVGTDDKVQLLKKYGATL